MERESKEGQIDLKDYIKSIEININGVNIDCNEFDIKIMKKEVKEGLINHNKFYMKTIKNDTYRILSESSLKLIAYGLCLHWEITYDTFFDSDVIKVDYKIGLDDDNDDTKDRVNNNIIKPSLKRYVMSKEFAYRFESYGDKHTLKIYIPKQSK